MGFPSHKKHKKCKEEDVTMSLQIEKLEHNMAKLTIEVDADIFVAAMKEAYNKEKGKFNIPGFRIGKVPRQMIEKMYGVEVFYEDAANALIPETFIVPVRLLTVPPFLTPVPYPP